MSYPISAGIQISLDNSTWYKLTDHNRQPIQSNPELIEKAERMANGRMRKYVIAKKEKFSTDWKYVPTKTIECVDGNQGPSWIESFYNANVKMPIYLKIVSSEISIDPSTGSVPDNFYFKPATEESKVYSVFITGFSKTLIHRTKTTDYVDMTIEFTEI